MRRAIPWFAAACVAACHTSPNNDYCASASTFYSNAFTSACASDGGAGSDAGTAAFNQSACEAALSGSSCSGADEAQLDAIGKCIVHLGACPAGSQAAWAQAVEGCVCDAGTCYAVPNVSSACLTALSNANSFDL